MNASELFALAHWVEREISKKNVVSRFSELHQMLVHNSQPNQPKAPFEAQKNNVLDVIRSIDLNALTVEQLVYLRKLGIEPHLGEIGIAQIEDILFRNSLDISTAADRINRIGQEIEKGIKKANQLSAGLEELVEIPPAPSGEALLRVTFTREASMSNVVDFKKWGNDWYDIGRGIAMANGHSPEDVRVVGATKGSIVIELAVVYAIAKTVSSILLQACTVADRWLNIRKQAEELRGLKLSNDKIALDLEKEADLEKEKGIEFITATILAELGKQKVKDGETVKVLGGSVKKLVTFVQKGGEVDCVLPETPAENPDAPEDEKAKIAELRQLQEAFKKVRVEEAKIRQLEFNEPKGEEPKVPK